LSYGG